MSLIDLLCVNLYPFVETIRKPGVEFAEIIENIDIGGPAMLAVDGLTIPEIATILEIPEGTVKSRIFYARKRLKETLYNKRRK